MRRVIAMAESSSGRNCKLEDKIEELKILSDQTAMLLQVSMTKGGIKLLTDPRAFALLPAKCTPAQQLLHLIPACQILLCVKMVSFIGFKRKLKHGPFTIACKNLDRGRTEGFS